MKCLSLRQPFAELLASGRKKIELRRWNTNFRGEFLIHASLNVYPAACRQFGINPASLARGAVIGKAVIYDVREYKSIGEFVADERLHLATYEEFGSSRYGFLIKDAVRFKTPIPAKGSLNFFELKI